MARRLRPFLVSMLAGAMIAAGCGGDDDESGDSGGGSASGATDVPANVARAIEDCKASIDQAPGLSPELEDALVARCEAAGEEGEAAVHRAAKEVCVEVVKDTVPAGLADARETAIKACG